MNDTNRNPLRVTIAATVGLLLVAGLPSAAWAQAPSQPAYAALGDSIEFGLGDPDGMGYVTPFGEWLRSVLGPATDVHNAGVPFAETRDILHTQLPQLLTLIEGKAPIVVSWGGGGNDLADVATGPQAAACRQSQSCLARFNALLNEVEQTIEGTIARIRDAVGPGGLILMRTQYNALAKTGCAPPALVALGAATLEGAPGTILERGLNDRIRSVADKYGARVVEVALLTLDADALVNADCIHPSSAGYDAILGLFVAASLPLPLP